MKKFFAGLITGLLISLSVSAFAAVQLKVVPNPFPVFINGDQAQVDAYNINGSTFLKLADLKQTGLDVKFADSKINVLSTFAATDPTDHSVPEIDNSNNPANVTHLEDGDDFTKTTYSEYSAINFKGNVYINAGQFVSKYGFKYKLSGQSNSFVISDKNKNLVLKTDDANSFNYVYYDGTPYLNILLISKYLGN